MSVEQPMNINGAYCVAVGVAVIAALLILWMQGAIATVEDSRIYLLWGARRRGSRGHNRTLPGAGHGARDVFDSARSGVSRRWRNDRLAAVPRDFDHDWILHCVVERIGFAVSESGACERRIWRGITTASNGRRCAPVTTTL